VPGRAGEQLPSPILTRLFQPFVRAAGGSLQRGLGLYIASEIARAHGGTLAVASGAGQLSFTFTMPLR
jgi:phosphoserine phosphatase RsbU/P